VVSQSAQRLQVLLLTEGTYPYHFGGVSTWCDLLLRELPEVDFTLMSMISDARLQPLYALPVNVVELRPVALWGVLDSTESQSAAVVPDLYRRRRRTSDRVLSQTFVPLLQCFLHELFVSDDEPERLGASIHAIHRFALEYELDTAMRSRAAWDTFAAAAAEYFPRMAASRGYPRAELRLSDLTSGMQWLHHVLFPIARPLPRVDVAHAAMSGVCAVVALCAKLEHGAGFLLTEHGIYIRECYLAEAGSGASLFLKVLRLRFALRVTQLSYAMADLISPCCDYNKRWEARLGAPADRLQTIYYGVDATTFSPAETPADQVSGQPPTVVWVGRINPLKDLRTLMEAAAVVHRERPDIRFLLYGSAAAEDEGYHQEILTLRRELALEDVVSFRGYIAQPAAAYHQADLVMLSSVSEAFPFSILEAMLCGKPVVATAVGGVPEEIGGCGVTVEPRNPAAMGHAILELMQDSERRGNLGRAARVKALRQYSLDQFGRAYNASYEMISGGVGGHLPQPVAPAGVSNHEVLEWTRPPAAAAVIGS
jgi:glycosyltransferase involved in cell wall biosynthesis